MDAADTPTREKDRPTKQPLLPGLEDTSDAVRRAVMTSADRLAGGLGHRLTELAEREIRVNRNAKWEEFGNMPARLIWEALHPGSAAFFVVYKLMHEARSTLPKIYRAIAWQLCSVQPTRFHFVTYREQLWSVLAASDAWPEDIGALTQEELRESIVRALAQRSKTDWWGYKDEDRRRDAEWIAERLRTGEYMVQGMRTLRRLQLAEQSALTAGNVIMHIPAKLEMLVSKVVSQAKGNRLPCHTEICKSIARLARQMSGERDWGKTVNVSVPFDLFTLEEDQRLRIVAMTRVKASRAEQEELRRRTLYLRFFAHWAFGRRKPADVSVVVAFYADKKAGHDEWLPTNKPLFNADEIWDFYEFWRYAAGTDKGGELIDEVTDRASAALKDRQMVTQLRTFVLGNAVQEGAGRLDQ